MHDVLDPLLSWWQQDKPVGMGTVVATSRSAPRPPGAALLVGPGDGGETVAVGSVSGGCVEGAVFDLALEAAASGRPVLQRYGIADDDAYAVGLTCGGTIEVFVERVDRSSFPDLDAVADDVAAGRPVAVATVVEHPDDRLVGNRLVIRPGAEPDGCPVLGVPAPRRLVDAVRADALGLLAAGVSETTTYGPDGQRRGAGCRVFVSSFAPRPRMLVFGAIDFAAATARMGRFLGYRVTVCDARPVFATSHRFPEADEVVTDWPHRYLAAQAAAGRLDDRTVVCVLTHDPKFDAPVLELALGLDLAYVGAMGSRRTHDDRLDRLRAAGVGDEALARLHSPIGLDLGARTPEETAVSIAAEIVASRWAGSGLPLTRGTGPIHRVERALQTGSI